MSKLRMYGTVLYCNVRFHDAMFNKVINLFWCNCHYYTFRHVLKVRNGRCLMTHDTFYVRYSLLCVLLVRYLQRACYTLEIRSNLCLKNTMTLNISVCDFL